MKVKQLIKLLASMDENAEVVVEGCDCAEICVGISEGDEAYEGEVILRRKDGCFKGDLELLDDNEKQTDN